jgi:hypothetical protein
VEQEELATASAGLEKFSSVEKSASPPHKQSTFRQSTEASRRCRGSMKMFPSVRAAQAALDGNIVNESEGTETIGCFRAGQGQPVEFGQGG